ncbi:MAG: hypothetical protein AUJ72_01385 [Candidatus Omnitrophica bacterium CG1_02_46_14]|nr:MAG: hypothetical protein AUJ72_01385 [Candidatus Omnitrophica bacterium CG1_02_46_14]
MPDTERLNNESYTRVFDRLSELARERTPFFADVWKRQEKEFGSPWVRDIAENVSLFLGERDEEAWKKALDGYADFSMDAARQQNYFEENRQYQGVSSANLLSSCYEDRDFMMMTYLPGLYLSHFLWRHHYKLLRFFRSKVLPSLTSPKFFYEIGVGTGLYSYETLRYFSDAHGHGIDISQYSLDFTGRLLTAGGMSKRYQCEKMDIFKSCLEPEKADFLVCQEVLEHLEDPERSCRILLTLIKPSAKAYITAAINAAHTDHIYLFNSPSEVEAMLRSAGWRIIRSCAEYAYTGKALEVTPCVAGFLCEKI